MWRRCVCWPKLNVEHHIEVELEMDELNLTAAEKKLSIRKSKIM